MFFPSFEGIIFFSQGKNKKKRKKKGSRLNIWHFLRDQTLPLGC